MHKLFLALVPNKNVVPKCLLGNPRIFCTFPPKGYLLPFIRPVTNQERKYRVYFSVRAQSIVLVAFALCKYKRTRLYYMPKWASQWAICYVICVLCNLGSLYTSNSCLLLWTIFKWLYSSKACCTAGMFSSIGSLASREYIHAPFTWSLLSYPCTLPISSRKRLICGFILFHLLLNN